MEQSIILELITRWDVPIVPTLLLALVAAVYVTGWVRARKSRPIELPRWRAAAFLFGVVCVFIAISSPLDTLGESFLFMHMAQHSYSCRLHRRSSCLVRPSFPCCVACPAPSSA